MSCNQQPDAADDCLPHQTGEHSSTPASPVPSVNSAELLRGHRELLIQHDGETYRLRLTKTGKLILNK
ncbi:MAG TPA: hemin uptake protein HemP [Planctomycetaceae bacterium]|nr:hemin uptake protein HemP [Planctomycetaceae bacterium]